MTCSYTEQPCQHRHLCEWCPVPGAFGFFLEQDKNGRMLWKQKFILPLDLKLRLGAIEYQIAQLEKERLKLLEIPSKEEYRKALLNEEKK